MRRETEFIELDLKTRFSATGERSPLLARRGGCGIKKKLRSLLSAADGVVVQARTKNSLLEVDLPPRLARKGGFAKSLNVLGTPPGQEGCSLACGISPSTGKVKPTRQLLTWIAFISALSPLAALAQEEEGPRLIQIPNPMAAHTWFIIAAVGAFLAWCISYVLQFRRNQLEKSDKAKRITLLHEKDELLDRLAQLESEKEAGTIPGPRYEKEYRKARSRLSDVLSRLGGKRDSGEE
jgi:hypothetical protein